jgi:hypothetical protein
MSEPFPDSIEESGMPSRACGGARFSESRAAPAEGALLFRCARILSITAGSSMQRFDASTMILTCPAQRSQVSVGPPPDRSGGGPIEHPLQPLHSGHRRMAPDGRLVQPVPPRRLTQLVPPASLRRCHPHTKLAVRGENAVRPQAPRWWRALCTGLTPGGGERTRVLLDPYLLP